MAKGIGPLLRAVRQQWQLSLREVEERSLRFAQQQGNQAYQVSASWLDRLEREEHDLTVNKLIVLADIYNLPTEQLLRYIYPGDAQPLLLTDETTLLAAENSSPYRRGIIGKRDLTLSPMIPAGSIVQIDTQNRIISSRKDWTHEFQRPIYFLTTRDAYVCGWCELDKNSDWLTLIPHPLSQVPSRRWRYRKEIEMIGRVTLVAIRLTP